MILSTKKNVSVSPISGSMTNAKTVYRHENGDTSSDSTSAVVIKKKQGGQSMMALRVLAVVITVLSVLQFHLGHHQILQDDNRQDNNKHVLPPPKRKRQTTLQTHLQLPPKTRKATAAQPAPINKTKPTIPAKSKQRITKTFAKYNQTTVSMLRNRTRPPRKQATTTKVVKLNKVNLTGMPTEPSPDNFNVNWRLDANDKDAVKLLVSKEELVFLQQRHNRYHAWRNASMMDMESKRKLQPRYNPKLDFFNHTADEEGPWLDFLISGYPKCGSTTMMATLSQIAPMPDNKDVCELTTKLMSLVYEEWPYQYGQAAEYGGTSPLLLRGSKCPNFVGNLGGAMMKIFTNAFRRTKLIIGIRHPVSWFQSFWRMQGREDPYHRLNTCWCKSDEHGLRYCKNQTGHAELCWNECGKSILCLARARFHVTLAQLGKTNLTDDEREWLAPNDFDGGKDIVSLNIPNRIFLYDQTELKKEYLWEGLASYLRVSKIPEQQFKGAKGKNLQHLSLCDPRYDAFRAMLMPYSYELSVWLQEYLLPLARDPSREDVVVADVDRIAVIFETYKTDPCGRLILHIDNTQMTNGTRTRPNIAYVLDPTLNTTFLPRSKW